MGEETPSAAALVPHLKKVRAGAGLTPLVVPQELVELLDATSQMDAYQTIKLVAARMKSSGAIRAMRNAYGLGWQDPMKLNDRRITFSAENDGISLDTIENWENQGIEELAVWLSSPGWSSAPVHSMAATATLRPDGSINDIQRIIRYVDDPDYQVRTIDSKHDNGTLNILLLHPETELPGGLTLYVTFDGEPTGPVKAEVLMGESFDDLALRTLTGPVRPASDDPNTFGVVFREVVPFRWYALVWEVSAE